MTGFVTDGFLRTAEEEPGKTAIVLDKEMITYETLAHRALGFANYVTSVNAKRVALVASNTIPFLEVFLGTLISGAIIMVIDPKWPLRRVVSLIEEHGPQIIVADRDVFKNLEKELSLRPLICEDDLERWRSSKSNISSYTGRFSPEMPFLMGFTSGSTGYPKAFLRTHESWVSSFSASATELGTQAHDKVMIPGPLSHGLALYAAIENLCVGGTVYLQRQFNAQEIVQHITLKNVSVLVVVPTMLDIITEVASAARLPAIERIITAGSKLQKPLRDKAVAVFSNAELIEYYGASEVSFITVARSSEEPPEGSVGRSFRGVSIDIRDPSGRSLPFGNTGVIWARSKMLSLGYVNVEEDSPAGFREENGWATVGDIGHLDSLGFLYLRGREGDMIISGGYNVFPEEVERVLLGNPYIKEACVFSLPHSRWGQVVCAAVCFARPKLNQIKNVKEWCSGKLAHYQCPKRYFGLEGLPMTSSGKVSRSKVVNAITNQDSTITELFITNHPA